MPSFTRLGAEIWRDYETEGMPGSGAHNISKSHERTWKTEAEAYLAALAAIGTAIVTPEDYGAVGNGVADDTTALQSFFNNSTKMGRLKAGSTYLIDADSVVVPTGGNFIGPRSASIKNADGSGTTLGITTSNVRLAGFTVDGGNSSSTIASGFELGHFGVEAFPPLNAGAYNATLDNIVLEGLYVKNCGDAGIELHNTTHARVLNNKVERCGYAGIAAWSANDIIIDGNRVDNIYPGETPGTVGSNCYGIVISRYATYSGAVSLYAWITNNHVSTVTWEGIDEHDAQYVEISGNVVRACGTGIAIEHHTAGAVAKKITITNNKILGVGLGVTLEAIVYPGISGINANGAVQDSAEQGRDLVIANNHIESCGDTRSSPGTGGGISVRNFRGVTIAANYLVLSYRYGIVCDNGSVDSVLHGAITGNTIDGTVTVSAVAKDIFVSTRVALQVVGNFMAGNGDGASQAGSPTYVTTFASNYLFS